MNTPHPTVSRMTIMTEQSSMAMTQTSSSSSSSLSAACLYYTATQLRCLPEQNASLLVHQIVSALGLVSLPYPLSIAYCKWPRHQHSLASRHSSRPAYVQISLVLKGLVKTIRIPSQMTSSIRHETSQLLYLSKADHPKDFEQIS